jgi:hypothetical protein
MSDIGRGRIGGGGRSSRRLIAGGTALVACRAGRPARAGEGPPGLAFILVSAFDSPVAEHRNGGGDGEADAHRGP